jgi:hypothetical protein
MCAVGNVGNVGGSIREGPSSTPRGLLWLWEVDLYAPRAGVRVSVSTVLDNKHQGTPRTRENMRRRTLDEARESSGVTHPTHLPRRHLAEMTHVRVDVLLDRPHWGVRWEPDPGDEPLVLAPQARRQGEVATLVVLVVDDIPSAVQRQLVAEHRVRAVERCPAN